MIPLPSQPKVIKKEGSKALFEIAGCYPGYGITIGNSLRRVLLSSLEGAAITQVKIEGVSHEFSTIPGVMEDVVMLLLNLKRLTFKCFSDIQQTITLKVKGEKEVNGSDFKLTSELELCNPKEHIATLTKPSAELNIECKVAKGIGYEPVEAREVPKSEIGVMQIDAIFTPVRKVSLKVENMRVGKRTDFDLLKLEIETDGTITPEQALKQASCVLLSQFSVIFDGIETEEAKKLVKKEAKAKPARPPAKAALRAGNASSVDAGGEKTSKGEGDAKKMKIEDFDIPERIKNALLKNNIKTVGGMLRKSEKTIGELEGLGGKAVVEIKKALKKLKLELK